MPWYVEREDEDGRTERVAEGIRTYERATELADRIDSRDDDQYSYSIEKR